MGLCPFQFTPLREGRPALARRQRISETYFNSRPSARGDGIAVLVPEVANLFQFTPLREGRRFSQRFLVSVRLFQFTPLREGRPLFSISCGLSEKFQFTPLREGRRKRFVAVDPSPHFNSRPSARGDVDFVRPGGQLRNFNSRPSARGDGKRYAISANLLFNPYKSAWLNNSATQFVEIILVIFHRIIA